MARSFTNQLTNSDTAGANVTQPYSGAIVLSSESIPAIIPSLRIDDLQILGVRISSRILVGLLLIVGMILDLRISN